VIGLLPESPETSHADEEQCLFFVGLSRARDVLTVSHADRYSEAMRSGESPFIATLKRSVRAGASWNVAGHTCTPPTPQTFLHPVRDTYPMEGVDAYIRCPRAYLYHNVLSLSRTRDDTAYLRFHRCVYSVLRWLRASTAPTEAEALTELAQRWDESKLTEHPYASLYRRAADGIVRRVWARRTVGEMELPTWSVPLGESIVEVTPDLVEVEPAVVSARRLRTGKAPKQDADDDLYALYHLGLRLAYPIKQHRVEVVYLSDDKIVPVTMSGKVIAGRTDKYLRAIQGIAQGHFPPIPSDHGCPRCPHYFICPTLPRGPLTD
jgi:hypothetical protein